MKRGARLLEWLLLGWVAGFGSGGSDFDGGVGSSCGTVLSEFAVPTGCLNAPTTAMGVSYKFVPSSGEVCQVPAPPMEAEA